MQIALKLQIIKSNDSVNAYQECDYDAEINSLDSLTIFHKDNNYYLLLPEKALAVKPALTIKSQDFVIKVMEQINEASEPGQEGVLENRSAIMSYNKEKNAQEDEPKFLLTAVKQENNFFDLNKLMQVPSGYTEDELDFLFTHNTHTYYAAPAIHTLESASNKIVGGKDPLSLLNEHFQPPAVHLAAAPIIITQPEEFLTENTLTFNEGNILRDLGLLAPDNFTQTSTLYLNTLPAPQASISNYKDDEKGNIRSTALDTTKQAKLSTWGILKKHWQNIL